MPDFHGANKNRSYFEGWYLKAQNDTDTVALIPALHIDETGEKTASLQLLTSRGAHRFCFAGNEFSAATNRFGVRLGQGFLLNQTGCRLDLEQDGCRVKGVLRFGDWTPPRYGVMGPLEPIPGLQCRHSVLSLRHPVEGHISINDEPFHFEGGMGYLEGDRGRSFPRQYLWSQCLWEHNSLMLAVADVPLLGKSFRGCLALVLFEGREYRFASYLGAEVLHADGASVLLRQGERLLQAELVESAPMRLLAPQAGGMSRRVWASAACQVRYRLCERDRVLFELTSARACFEQDWK